jgi:hypothetical protein
MKVCRAFALVAVLVGIPLQTALAQFGGMPGLPGSAPPGGPGAGFGGPAAPPAACNELLVLRDQTQKHAAAIGAANERKAVPQEACTLFKTFLASEIKLMKGVEDNATRCGIPPEVAKQMKVGHAKAAEIGKKVCDFAANPRPTGPSFSDVFGAPTVPEKDASKRPGGTFDTLTGNALGK